MLPCSFRISTSRAPSIISQRVNRDRADLAYFACAYCGGRAGDRSRYLPADQPQASTDLGMGSALTPYFLVFSRSSAESAGLMPVPFFLGIIDANLEDVGHETARGLMSQEIGSALFETPATIFTITVAEIIIAKACGVYFVFIIARMAGFVSGPNQRRSGSSFNRAIPAWMRAIVGARIWALTRP